MEEQTSPLDAQLLDITRLKALAHPIRIALLESLSRHGAQTACGVADRLGESSGSTSYHLRQLAKHGFVREVEGKGTARERWWERVPEAIQTSSQMAKSPATRDATRILAKSVKDGHSKALIEFINNSDSLPDEWAETSILMGATLHLTLEEAQEVSRQASAHLDKLLSPYRGRADVDGTRPVELHLNYFPLIDPGAQS
ncbi:helix-turn-helix domain-containing protein [Arthrobacter koreensis]|uniref:ArsR/SmtB family transcription factor n=1 Tax=Arthrobacter koreensis TaxID=199136 RepID=UPI002DB76E00|nr:helix-turn-helix domain-containing protein [Arthrobacter koreensis]MEB7505447.1 helix-turn-helix domain-containing protein [Arthrobacter koreensis]